MKIQHTESQVQNYMRQGKFPEMLAPYSFPLDWKNTKIQSNVGYEKTFRPQNKYEPLCKQTGYTIRADIKNIHS